MNELNKVMEKYISEIGYFYTDDFSNIKKLSEIILSVREPRFEDKIKTRFGINKSINLSYQFFNSFDKEYGDYFQKRLIENGYIFEHVKKNNSSNAYSFFDYNIGQKKMYIPYKNQIFDAFAIVHETFHDANLDINNLTLTRNLFNEYISMFGEFLFENFIKENYDIKCKTNNNYSFMACYTKALKVDFELNLFKSYLENGSINDYNFNCIIESYPEIYHGLLYGICYAIIVNNDFDFDYEMRYLFGILLSCYSYDRLLNNDFNIDIYKFIHENINELEPEEVYEYLDLKVIDDYTLLLSPDSYDKLNKSYKKIMGNR